MRQQSVPVIGAVTPGLHGGVGAEDYDFEPVHIGSVTTPTSNLTTSPATRPSSPVVHSGMVDSGNSLEDIYPSLPSPDLQLHPSQQIVALADGSARNILGSFGAAVCLDDHSEPLHYTSNSILPTHASAPSNDPIFSLPRWVDHGWRACFDEDCAYIQHATDPTKVFLSRTPRGLWRLHFYWRRPGEMVLVSATVPSGVTLPHGLHACHLSDDARSTLAPPPALPPPTGHTLPTEQSVLRSATWSPASQLSATPAPCSPASTALVRNMVASLDLSNGLTFDLHPDPGCPASTAIIHGHINDNLCAAVSLSHPGTKISSRAEWSRRFSHLGKTYMKWWLHYYPSAATRDVTAGDCACDLCRHIRSHATLIRSKQRWKHDLKPHPTGACWAGDLTRRHRPDRAGFRLALCLVDRATGFYVVYGLDSKTSIFDAFAKHNTFLVSHNIKWCKMVFDMDSMLHTYATADQMTAAMTKFTNDHCVHLQFTAPHAHWLNFMERSFRQLNLLANRALIGAHLSELCWLDALVYAADTMNIFPVWNGDESMRTAVPRCISYHWAPDPQHQLPFGALVCTTEPNCSHNQFKANTRLGVCLRNPTRSLMGWTVLRATYPFEVVQRLFLSYNPTEDLLPVTLRNYIDLRPDRIASEAVDNDSILARTDFTAFVERVFQRVDLDRDDGFLVFNRSGHIDRYQCVQIDDIPGFECADERGQPPAHGPLPAPASAPAPPPDPAPAPPPAPAPTPSPTSAAETTKTIRARPHATRLRFDQHNPKLAGSKSWHRYDKYKHSSTFGDFLHHGRVADLLWDLDRNYAEFLDDPGPEIVALLLLQVLEESYTAGAGSTPAPAASSHAPTINAIVDSTVHEYIRALLGYDLDVPHVCAAVDIEDELAAAEGRLPDTTPTIDEIMDQVLSDYLLQPYQSDRSEVVGDIVAALDIATGNPTGWRDVLNDGLRFHGWIESMKDELNKLLLQFKTFRVVPISEMHRARREDPDTRCLFGKFVYVDKGTRLRSRLVSCDSTKLHKMTDTWSPTVSSESVKWCISFACQHRVRLTSLDVGNAYLYGQRRDRPDGRPPAPVFLRWPRGMKECGYDTHDEHGEELVFAVEGNHYGLQDGGSVWYQTFRDWLLDLGFKQSTQDPCMLFRSWDPDDLTGAAPATADAESRSTTASSDGSRSAPAGFSTRSTHWCILLLYVDDVLALFSTDAVRERFLADMATKFKQSPESDDKSRVTVYCGFEITQSEDNSEAYIRTPKVYERLMRVCDHAGLSDLYTNPATTPLAADAIKTMAVPVSDDNPAISDHDFPARSILGSCAWAVLAARPAEIFCLAMLLQHMHKPTAAVVKAIKHFASFLLATRNDPLIYYVAGDMAHVFYADSSHGNVDFKGVIGRLSKHGPNSYAWRCRIPKVVTLSSRDAELMASILGARSAISHGLMLRELGLHDGEPLPLYTDSKSTELSATSDMINNESRWNGIRIRWLQQQITHGLIKLLWVDGSSMLADVMTKWLTPAVFMAIRRKLMNLNHGYGFLKRVTFCP